MIKFVLLFGLAFVVSAEPSYDSFSSFDEALEYETSKYDFDANYKLDLNHFTEFKLQHGKEYENDEEELKRFNIFRINKLKIKLLNMFDFGSAIYEINHFADLDEDEFKKHYTGLKFDEQTLKSADFSGEATAEIDRNTELPTEIDWREKGAVTEVKDQKSCGSCWAFSAIGSIESQNKIVNGDLLKLSEEEIVDCDQQSNGCGGGFMTWAFEAVQKLGGVELDKDYPYNARGGACLFNKKLSKVKISGYQNLTQNEDEIAQVVAQKGPVSIAINANLMQFYSKGIAHPRWFLTKWLCSPKMLNHGVLIVGFGETKKWGRREPYWIIKNSWSAKWGRQGYYYIHRGSNACGVRESASIPVVVKKDQN